MAIIKRVKGQTSHISQGKAYTAVFPVDDGLTSGIAWGKLVTIKGDGTSALYDYNANTGATLILADSTDETKPALGVALTTSTKDMYGALNLADSLVLYPFQKYQETQPIPLVKEVILEVYNDADMTAIVYNTLKIAATGTVSNSSNGATVTGVGTAFTTELAVGDWVVIGTEVRQISAIGSNTSLTVSENIVNANSGVALARDTDIGKKIYLTTSGDFTKIKPVTGVKQVVGEILDGNHVRIELRDIPRQ